MLNDLMKLRNASVTITVSDNGQVNLAVFSEGKTPLALTFAQHNAYEAEQEIRQYCSTQAPVQSSSTASDSNTAPSATTTKEPEQVNASSSLLQDDDDDFLSAFSS
ncbi:hypothetical protein VTH8203_03778 [Vibrio thalassae]|uniref:Uncharacterized protein n=1 Tax=Vibrio thalassae TaxID=1243014 RepID=A0A240EQ44_9VIBR|nr:hypothetical protein [Vibrio thalassae]SNX50125.1 hypothetical protein VTH8203_03778 [Vibrio thalassae]